MTALETRIPEVFARAVATLAARYPAFAPVFKQPRRVLLAGAAVMFAAAVAAFARALLSLEGLQTPQGPMIGGDFNVFWTVAQTMGSDAQALYNTERFQRVLHGEDGGGLMTWQYPPPMFLVLAPLDGAPFLPGYFAWMAAQMALFAAALAACWRRVDAIAFVFAAPLAFHAFITGQTGFAVGALLLIAAAFADRRPLLAGFAAGLLTLKPQFGVLIPLAFAAAGCWRAFASAAATGAALALASLAAYGAAVWPGFIGAALDQGGRLALDAFPDHKLTSFYGALRVAGVPASAALWLHGGLAAGAALGVAAVWRARAQIDWDLRAMTLLAAAPLVSPYAFYYEAPIALAAGFLLARRAAKSRWLPGEGLGLCALWIASLAAPGAADGAPVTAGLFLALAALVARRAFVEMRGFATAPNDQTERRAFIAAARVPSSR